MSEVFYRKWRPKSLGEVVGQEAITTTLKQAVGQGRVAHAYLFCGTRGTGKTSTARILAKAVNCLAPHNGEPDNECRICVSVNEGRALDLIEIDAASNRGIDDIRDLSDKIRFSPNEARFKVYIIDEVHMLTEPAFNALLKTLEEPPAHAMFILATTEAHKVPLTIISRCQRFDFRRIPLDQMTAKLAEICAAERIEASPDALRLISRVANGGLRDAENLLEQAIVSYGSPVSEDNVRRLLGLGGDEAALEFAAHIVGKSVSEGISAVNAAAEQGGDLRQLLRQTLEYLRALLLIKAGAAPHFGYSDEVSQRLSALAADAPMEHLVHTLKTFASVSMRRDSASPLPLELAMVESAAAPVARVAAPAPAYAPPRDAAAVGRPPSPAPPPVAPPAQRRPAPAAAQQYPPQSAPPHTPAAPASAPAAYDGQADEPAARLDSQWGMIANELRFVGSRLKLGAMLRSSKEREVIDDTIILKYPSRSNVDRLQQELDNPESRRALDDAIAKAMGGKFQVKVMFVNGSSGSGSQSAAQNSHLVRAAMSMGARVISEKEAQPQ